MELKEIADNIEFTLGSYEDTEELRIEAARVIQFVKRMIGCDTLMVELSRNTIVCAFEDAMEKFDMSLPDFVTGGIRNINEFRRAWIRNYTLASCMVTLGHIRGKIKSVSAPIAESKMYDLETGAGCLVADGRELQSDLYHELEIAALTIQKAREEGLKED